MSAIIQYTMKEWEVHEKTTSTTWGTDWYNLWYSWSLHHTLDPTRYNENMLKMWEGDCNKLYVIYKINIW